MSSCPQSSAAFLAKSWSVGSTAESRFASGKGVLYTADPPSIENVSPDPDDDKFLECALELEAEFVVSGDSDLVGLESYMGMPLLTPRELLKQVGQAPEEE